MKKIMLSFLLLCFGVIAFAQDNLKDIVCIIKPQYPIETKEFYVDYGRALAREGFVKSGALLRKMENGGFGSGVVIKYNEQYYVLTNYHVVDFATSASLEFQNSTNLHLKECAIINRNKDFDLALIALPANSGIQYGFSLSNVTLKEGTEVWSAGFPGIQNKPSWQLGKGIVSNEFFKDSSFINAKLTYIIQHTAQIDPGSSGGALLITQPAEKNEYAIVGINTWKAKGREGANFAIPTTAIIDFLQNVHTVNNDKAEQKVETRTKAFITSKNADNYKKILPFISDTYVYNIPAPEFIKMLKEASKEAKTDAIEAFRDVEPFQAFRIVIADAIYKKIKKATLTYVGSSENIAENYEITSKATLQGKEMQMQWAQTSGEWYLTNTSALKIKKTKEGQASVEDWEEVEHSVFGGIGFPSGKAIGYDYEFGYTRHYASFFATSGIFSTGRKFVEDSIYTMTGKYEKETKTLKYFGIELSLDFQVPLKFCPVYTIPFVKLPVGVNLGDDASTFYVGAKSGIRFAIKLGKGCNFLYLDTEYRYKYAVSQDDDDLSSSFSTFGLNLGYAW